MDYKMNEMQKMILSSFIFENKEDIKHCVSEFKNNPFEMRNYFAENGIEVTVDQMNIFFDQVQEILNEQ